MLHRSRGGEFWLEKKKKSRDSPPSDSKAGLFVYKEGVLKARRQEDNRTTVVRRSPLVQQVGKIKARMSKGQRSSVFLRCPPSSPAFKSTQKLISSVNQMLLSELKVKRIQRKKSNTSYRQGLYFKNEQDSAKLRKVEGLQHMYAFYASLSNEMQTRSPHKLLTNFFFIVVRRLRRSSSSCPCVGRHCGIGEAEVTLELFFGPSRDC